MFLLHHTVSTPAAPSPGHSQHSRDGLRRRATVRCTPVQQPVSSLCMTATCCRAAAPPACASPFRRRRPPRRRGVRCCAPQVQYTSRCSRYDRPRPAPPPLPPPLAPPSWRLLYAHRRAFFGSPTPPPSAPSHPTARPHASRRCFLFLRGARQCLNRHRLGGASGGTRRCRGRLRGRADGQDRPSGRGPSGLLRDRRLGAAPALHRAGGLAV